MGESILKKEFKKSDVERVRNLVRGTYGDSTKTIVGFGKVSEVQKHKEGDIWTDHTGKTWTIEDGLKVSVTKLSKARELGTTPLFCPKCGKVMSTRLDKKMFTIHRTCFDCVLKFEESLKRAGLYKEYESQMIQSNLKSFVQRLTDRIQDLQSSSEVQITTDEGTLERWGKISQDVIKNLEEWQKLLSEQLD